MTEREDINLYWYIEALWAFLWIGGLIDDLPINQEIQDYMVSLTPNLHLGEDTSKFTNTMQIRSYEEVYRMLDLYYRAHWYARDGQLRQYPTPNFYIDIIMERRKALEWSLDPDADWDNVQDGT